MYLLVLSETLVKTPTGNRHPLICFHKNDVLYLLKPKTKQLNQEQKKKSHSIFSVLILHRRIYNSMI